MVIKCYRELIVWQKTMDIVEKIYIITKGFPKEEMYGMTSQIRRAAVSIPSNIAEGQARKSSKEFHHFLSISLGSKAELETQILLSQRLGYISIEASPKILLQLEEISRLLNGLIKSLNNSSHSTGHSLLTTDHCFEERL